MNQQVRQLFHELADLPRRERARILDERRIPHDLRTEVESLLSFDSADDSLTGRVAQAAESALRDVESREAGVCGPYRLVRLLGSGGMGAVYLGERSDGEIQQRVAIKLLRAGAGRPEWRDRFLRERQLLAWLNHPAVARLLDAGHTSAGQPYLVMEYVEGVTIDAWCAGKDRRDVLVLFLRVCEGVSHAHRHLIIHRDIKPSNILVDAAGQPKLLDFGIARLLDETADATRTVERMLTPSYASPEQLRGDVQTTATDVYSLAVVLDKLLRSGAPMPRDIECIVRKASRDEPAERYASVEALANDVRRFLARQPVEARSGNAWYRARRFLRRSWLPLSAAAMTAAGLTFGIYVANHERSVAHRRFVQVRQLANKVLSLDDDIIALPGATKVRHEIVAMSEEYLEALGPGARDDRELAFEIGRAFLRLARAQGVPVNPNLGQYAQAAESLRKAAALVEPLVQAAPRDRQVLVASAEIAHDRMILSDSNRHDAEAVAFGRKAAERMEALLTLGRLTPSEMTSVAQMFTNIALAHKNQHRYADAVRYGERVLALETGQNPAQSYRGPALTIIADSRRLSGDLAGALEAVRQARAAFDQIVYGSEHSRRSNQFSSMWREGVILGEAGSINLGRTDEAIALLQKASDLMEEAALQDPNDSASRVHLANAAWKLGDILRERDPRRALATYDQGIRRLREVQGNATVRRQEAQLLAASSYPLRQLGRSAEAGGRIDTALRLLRETKTYPAAQIEPGSETDAILCAQADHLAASGETERAAELYAAVLDKIMASKPEPLTDLRHASRLSNYYAALAGLNRRMGRIEQADALAARRLAIWRAWDARLPGNPFIRGQLEAAGKP